MGFEGGDVNLYAYVGNNPILLIDPDGLWTLQIGWSVSGGAGGGGTYGKGIVFGYSKEKGFQWGTYKAFGGGGYGGAGGSLAVDITVSGNTDIRQLAGQGGSVGGSGQYGLATAGLEVNINQGAEPSYTFSAGVGLPVGTFVEQHGYATKTTIKPCKK
ncbi:MAG: hypothetical protein ACOYU4_04705 [Thermodesulfobacteriota bacterium]